ncbi:oxidoreducate, putative [Trypanosoma vivax Y486]|uniref:Oxidoreducate, putative n=1 Tax=Trypanosoma vivax (strain Y486) TaxID=1055687 RepID=F9WQ33_TRYVY|nr:oxidoreducate, putative [Trypanosoma vivax Y486]|eukprot:CCD19660.1 oxidoreducate, putative [Trypanosoma vivax Y486]
MSRRHIFDVLVLGAGAAGCSAARAIALHNPKATVGLIEQGSRHSPPLAVRVPLFSPLIANSRGTRSFLRTYRGVVEHSIGGRQLQYVKGCGLGGSTLCNDMKYLRGTTADFAAWGHPEWTMERLLPFFISLERNSRNTSRAVHGDSGPLPVTDPPRTNVSLELNIRWFEACEMAGIGQTGDFNAGEADGFSTFQSHIDKGVRVDVFDALLQGERHLLSNLEVMCDTRARRLLFDDGRRVTGVEVCRDNDSMILHAGRVVVCLGALESPALLQRSGVCLRGAVADVPGVGQNLIQSSSATVVFRIARGGNLRSKSLSWTNAPYLLQQWREYNEDRSGIFASLAEGGAFVRSTPSTEHPDISLTFYATPNVRWCGWRPFDGFSVRVSHHYPSSRGEVVVVGGGGDNLCIKSRMFTSRHDVECMDECLRWIGSICYGNERRDIGDVVREGTSPFTSLGAVLHLPERGISTQHDLATFLAQHAESTGELFGTCALGNVVDGALRVHGVSGVHVADASVVPAPTCGTASVIGAAVGSRIALLLECPNGSD